MPITFRVECEPTRLALTNIRALYNKFYTHPVVFTNPAIEDVILSGVEFFPVLQAVRAILDKYNLTLEPSPLEAVLKKFAKNLGIRTLFFDKATLSSGAREFSEMHNPKIEQEVAYARLPDTSSAYSSKVSAALKKGENKFALFYSMVMGFGGLKPEEQESLIRLVLAIVDVQRGAGISTSTDLEAYIRDCCTTTEDTRAFVTALSMSWKELAARPLRKTAAPKIVRPPRPFTAFEIEAGATAETAQPPSSFSFFRTKGSRQPLSALTYNYPSAGHHRAGLFEANHTR